MVTVSHMYTYVISAQTVYLKYVQPTFQSHLNKVIKIHRTDLFSVGARQGFQYCPSQSQSKLETLHHSDSQSSTWCSSNCRLWPNNQSKNQFSRWRLLHYNRIE